MSGGNYAVSSRNATKHGALSKAIVLPWEQAEDYASLESAFCEEYKPEGPTEEHLVQELISAVWRKRRILLGESSLLRSGLARVHQGEARLFGRNPADDGFTTTSGLPDPEVYRRTQEYEDLIFNLRELIETGRREQLTDEKVEEFLSNTPYLDRYREFLAEDETGALVPLLRFLRELEEDAKWELECFKLEQEKTKTHRAGLAAKEAFSEQLARYEVHLDRKFQKTLSLLIQVQERREVKSVS